MGKLIIVRHGECEANVRGVVAGARDDSPLTEKGIQDAEGTAELLAGRTIDRIVSSPLIRARETAQIIASKDFPDLEIEIDPAFSERDVGDATGLPLAEYFEMEKAGEIAAAETAEQMFDRVKVGVDRLREISGTILLVTHNGTFRVVRCVLESLAPEEFANIPGLANGQIFETEI